MIQTELLSVPNVPEISIAVPPKVGCHAVRAFLWELGGGTRWSGGGLFEEFYRQGIHRSVLEPKIGGELRIAVHRDGVSRMRAVYDHRIVELKEWRECTIEEFAWNLADACVQSPSIDHHARPQWHWLGGDPREFDVILPLDKLDLLPGIAATHLGRPVPALQHTHKTTKLSEVSAEARRLFEKWTAYDTEIGWDGRSTKGI